MPDLLTSWGLQTVKCVACEILDFGEPNCYICCGCTTNMQRYMLFEDLSLDCVGYSLSTMVRHNANAQLTTSVACRMF